MNLSSLMRFFRGGRRRHVNVNLTREGGETAYTCRHLHAAAAWKAPATLPNPLTTSIPMTTQTYSTTSGGNVSLHKLMMGQTSKKLLWEEIVPGMARPSPLFRLAMRRVYESLSKLQREGRWHGNLKPENIIFPGFDMAKPILVEFSDTTGDIAKDFKSLGNIIKKAFTISNCNDMDPETIDFVKFLQSERVGKMHYWMMSAHDREDFFLDFSRKCPFVMEKLLTRSAPPQVSLLGSEPSKYFDVCVGKTIWEKYPLSFATKRVRDFFQHYGDSCYSYNEGRLQTTVTLHEAELDFYRFYPDYFPALYEELQKFNIEYILN